MTVPYTFGTQTGPIPLSELDANFATCVTNPTQTTAEIAAGVTPTNTNYAPGNVLRYGADPTGVADSTTAIQNGINCAQSGYGYVYLPPGTYKITSSLVVSSVDGIDIVGARQSHFQALPGVSIVYTGTGSAISINPSGTSNLQVYRVNISNIGIYFTSATASAGINLNYVQESTFYNVGINGNGTQTITNGINCTGVGIVNFDNLVMQNVTNGIFCPGNNGAYINITRCNIYNVTTGLRCGLTERICFSENWVEGFQNAILIDNADNAPYGASNYELIVDSNTFLQTTAALTETRAFSIKSTNNTYSVRVRAVVSKNWIVMSSGSATAPSYAISAALSGNSAVVDVNVDVYDNMIQGVTVAGCYSDSLLPTFTLQNNDTRVTGFGTKLPNQSGGASLYRSYTLYSAIPNTSAGNDTTEDTLLTVPIPASLLGTNNTIRITAFWNVTNNANAKTCRIRFSGASGTIIHTVSAASTSSVVSTVLLTAQNSTSGQFSMGQAILNGANPQTSTSGSAVNTAVATSLVFTGQKATAGDTLSLYNVIVELLPSAALTSGIIESL